MGEEKAGSYTIITKAILMDCTYLVSVTLLTS